MSNKVCPNCKGPLIHKSKTQLFWVGIAFAFTGDALLFISFKFIPLTLFLGAISVYLIAWSTFGKGLWCRQCKSVPFK
jgi:hypothetical protein